MIRLILILRQFLYHLFSFYTLQTELYFSQAGPKQSLIWSLNWYDLPTPWHVIGRSYQLCCIQILSFSYPKYPSNSWLPQAAAISLVSNKTCHLQFHLHKTFWFTSSFHSTCFDHLLDHFGIAFFPSLSFHPLDSNSCYSRLLFALSYDIYTVQFHYFASENIPVDTVKTYQIENWCHELNLQ